MNNLNAIVSGNRIQTVLVHWIAEFPINASNNDIASENFPVKLWKRIFSFIVSPKRGSVTYQM